MSQYPPNNGQPPWQGNQSQYPSQQPWGLSPDQPGQWGQQQPPQWQGQQPSQPLQPNTGYQQPSGSGWPQQQQGMYPQQQQYQQPMPPGGYPPPQQPKKKSKRGIWIIVGILAVVMLASCVSIAAIMANAGNAVQTSANTTLTAIATDVPTTAATSAATSSTSSGTTWTTTQTFTGNGIKKTATFTVGNDWKIIWKCNPASFEGGQYNMIVGVDGSDGSMVDPVAINTICKVGNTGDTTEEHQGGSVYLDVTSEGAWSITVQELK